MQILGKRTIGTIAYMGGIPAIPEKFVWSWSQMIEYNNDYLVEPTQRIFYNRATVSYHAYARNSLVDAMQGDWLLMLDTDHQFEPDLAARMLYYFEKDNLDVLTGLYQYTSHPYYPKIYRFKKDLSNVEYIADWEKLKGNYYIPIDAAGAGCLLIRKSVFKKIRKKFKSNPFDIIHPFSEDLSFFLRLKKLDIKVYCAPMIESYHLQMRPLNLADYDKKNLSMGEKVDIL